MSHSLRTLGLPLEQIGMSARSLETYLIAVNLVDQQPIWLNMRIAEVLPCTIAQAGPSYELIEMLKL